MAKDIKCPGTMEIIRGTTPTIIINVRDNMDLSLIEEVWVYIYQNKKVKVDRTTDKVEVIADRMRIAVTLTQEETLSLKKGEAIFQVRLLMADGTALASIGRDIDVKEIYKEGVIEDV